MVADMRPGSRVIELGPGTGAVTQAILDAGSCFFVYTLARKLFDFPTALLAGIVAAVYGPFIFFTGTLLTPTLITFLGLTTLLLLVRYQENPKWSWALGAGAVLGLATLARVARSGTWLHADTTVKVSRRWVYRMMALSLPAVFSNSLLRLWIKSLRRQVENAI